MTRVAAESTHAHKATVEDDTINLRYSEIVPLDLRLVDHGAAHNTIGPLQRRMGTDFVSTIGGSGCGATLPRMSGCNGLSMKRILLGYSGTLRGRQSSPKDSDRSGGQSVLGVLSARELRCCRRTVGIGVALLAGGVPLILRLAERDHRHRAQEKRVAVTACIMKYDPDSMRVVVILVDQHERPLTIRALQGIARHQKVSVGVFDLAGRGVEPMLGVFGFCPLLRDELRGKELGRLLLDLVMLVNHEHVVGSPTVGTSGMGWRVGQGVIVVRGLAACGEKSAERVRQPQSTKDVDRGLAAVIVGFGIEQGHPGRQPVIAPDLHDVSDQLRFLIKVLPWCLASVVRIVLERHEGEILKTFMSPQIVEEAPEPGSPASRIGPHLDVLGDSFKDRSAQFEIRIDTVEGS